MAVARHIFLSSLVRVSSRSTDEYLPHSCENLAELPLRQSFGWMHVV